MFLRFSNFMNKKDLLVLLNKLDFHPSKKLGQNFLVDDNLLNFINKTANVKQDEFIIEIGPGLGDLTVRLLNSGANLTAIEFDSRLYKYLGDFIKNPKFNLIHEDALKVDFDDLMKNNPDFRMIANLPYSITTPLIATLAVMETPPSEMLLLLQKETAERLLEKPNNKNYGSITVVTQTLYKTELIRTVAPEVFHPQPQVHSAIVKLKRQSIYPDIDTRKFLNIVVRKAFSKRRKKVVNNLQEYFEAADLKTIFNEFNFDQNLRAENLSPDDYLKLTVLLMKIKK